MESAWIRAQQVTQQTTDETGRATGRPWKPMGLYQALKSLTPAEEDTFLYHLRIETAATNARTALGEVIAKILSQMRGSQ